EVRLEPGATPEGEIEIFCGNAGTMLRFLVATLTAVPGRWRLDGVPRLRERPVGPLVDALRRLGGRFDYLGEEGRVPLRIEGGHLRGGTVALDAGESSQYLSAMLMAALRAPGEVVIEVPALTSRPYVDVTIAAATAFDGHIERVGPRAYRVRPSALRRGPDRRRGDARRALAGLQAGGPRAPRPARRDGRRGRVEGRRPQGPRRRAARGEGRSLRHAGPGPHPGCSGAFRQGRDADPQRRPPAD